MKQLAKLGLLLMIGVSMLASAGLFGNSKGWKEEVQLHDGRVLVIERHFNLGGFPTLDAREHRLLDETITFTLPESKQKVVWKTEFDDRVAEPNSVGPLLLDIVDGVPYLATSPAGCIAFNKWKRPNPPYILFKYVNAAWQQITMDEFPAILERANLMNMPASSQLKPYYDVAAVKAKLADGRIAAYAKTIMRVSTPGDGGPATNCGEMIRVKDGWEGTGFFSGQPSKVACLKYCERKEVSAQDCPCDRLFKGK